MEGRGVLGVCRLENCASRVEIESQKSEKYKAGGRRARKNHERLVGIVPLLPSYLIFLLSAEVLHAHHTAQHDMYIAAQHIAYCIYTTHSRRAHIGAAIEEGQ